jgi:hypothetical protein
VIWPLPTGRRTWREFGVPDAVAVKVGGGVERRLLLPVFVLVALVAGVAVLAPGFLHHLADSALG